RFRLGAIGGAGRGGRRDSRRAQGRAAPLRAAVGGRGGDPLLERFRSLLGRRHFDRSPARGAGAGADGRPRRHAARGALDGGGRDHDGRRDAARGRHLPAAAVEGAGYRRRSSGALRPCPARGEGRGKYGRAQDRAGRHRHPHRGGPAQARRGPRPHMNAAARRPGIVARLAAIEDGTILRAAFFAMLAGTLTVLYIDYRELTAADVANLAAPLEPVLPAFDPDSPVTGPGPAVTSDLETLKAPLQVALGSA